MRLDLRDSVLCFLVLIFARLDRALAAGATNLIPELVAKGMPPPETSVNQLTLEHWAMIANVYDAWPFKSEVSRSTPLGAESFADPFFRADHV